MQSHGFNDIRFKTVGVAIIKNAFVLWSSDKAVETCKFDWPAGAHCSRERHI